MISVYDIGNEDYEKNGNAVLIPTECTVSETAGGSWELQMSHPVDEGGKWEHLVNEAIIKCPVPVRRIANAMSGIDADIYTVDSDGTALREGPREPVRITYQAWKSGYEGGNYEPGDKVTNTRYDNHNYVCLHFDETSGMVNVPPHNNPEWWKRISDTTVGDPVLTTLSAGTELIYEEASGTHWSKVMTTYGLSGYLRNNQITFDHHQDAEILPDRIIKDQLFRIYEVDVDGETMTATVKARHVSYDLNGVLIRDCKLSMVSPAMAIERMKMGWMIPYRGTVATNLTSDENGTYTGDVSLKSGTYGFLDPDKGMVRYFRGQLMRDNWDIFILKNDIEDRGMRITYGKNLKGVVWTRKVDDRINRVVPVAKSEGGTELFLPELWIDSDFISEQPVIRMEYLKVQGQVGKDNGTETDTNWTEQALLEEMRRKAHERFDVDHCDAECESVKIDFVLLGDTEEYRQYRDLETVSMYDRVTVTDPRIGMQLQLQVSATEYDAIRRRYRSITVGDVFNYGGRTVSSYQIGDGAIYYEKIAQSTIDRIISEVV